MKHSILTTVAVLALTQAAFAQSRGSIVGDYDLRGESREGERYTGSLRIEAQGDEFVLTSNLEGQEAREEARAEGSHGGRYYFVFPAPEQPAADSVGLATVVEETAAPDMLEVTASTLNVRPQPGVSAGNDAFTSVSRGQQVEVTGDTREIDGVTWHEVRVDGRTGWASSGRGGRYLQTAEGGPEVPAGARVLEVYRHGDGLRGLLKQGGETLAREQYRVAEQVQAALLVHAKTYDETQVNAFHAYASQLADYYDGQGFERSDLLLGTGYEAVIEALQEAAAEGRPYSRLVFIGHGGWDGPSLGVYSDGNTRQLSGRMDQAEFGRFVAAVRAGMTPDGKIYSSSCHAGGSNRYEADRSDYRWVDDVAAQTGRTAAGPNGYTSTEYTYRQVLAALEGQGTTRQETRWAGPEGTRTIRPRGTLSGTRLD